MMPLVTTILSIILLAAAFLLGWLLRVVPPANPAAWLAPVIMLVAGFWGCWRARGGRFASAAILLAGLTVWSLANMVWPGNGHVGEPPPEDQEGRLSPALEAVDVEVPRRYRNGVFDESRVLQAPPDTRIQVFAAGLGAPRFLAWHPDGPLLATIPKSGKVVALVDVDGDGSAEQIVDYATGLDRPHGIAVRGREVLVAENTRLVSLPDADGDLRADRVDLLSTDLPGGGGHWTRSLVIAPDGDLIVSAGSSCNVCEETDWRRAAILRFPPGGGDARLLAGGLRNSVGMAVHPATGELWASDNGRDMLGDDLPPDEINRIVAGNDYGWPYCYGDQVPDPEFGDAERCRGTTSPEVQMQAHSAPLGIDFGQGLPSASGLDKMLLVAYHGSWNRRVPTGYKLVGIPFADGRPSGPPRDLVSGWLQGRQAWGRPVAPLVGPDRALYLTDDRAGAVYRISWPGEGRQE